MVVASKEFDRIDIRFSSLETPRFTGTRLFDLTTLRKCLDLNNDSILTEVNSI